MRRWHSRRLRLAETFDPKFGGFGAAPKFPHAGSIDRLLRDWRATARILSLTCRRYTWRR